jgi:UV DNA damage repair endonuclease
LNNSEENVTPIVNDIVHLANQLGMDDADDDNVQELLQSCETGLTNAELRELEQQNTALENSKDSRADNVEVMEKINNKFIDRFY